MKLLFNFIQPGADTQNVPFSTEDLRLILFEIDQHRRIKRGVCFGVFHSNATSATEMFSLYPTVLLTG